MKGKSLQQYVSVYLPKLSNGQPAINLNDWDKWINNNVLFILDGLDECKEEDSQEINLLLNSINYTGKCKISLLHSNIKSPIKLKHVLLGASIIGTTRPRTNGSKIDFHQFTRCYFINGLNHSQIEKIIDTYFEEERGMAEEMKNKLFSNKAFMNLVACPLLCKIFCKIMQNNGTFPEKETGVYFRLVECLIRWI